MKKLFTLLFAATLFVACNNTKTEKVEAAPTKVSITYVNSTDQPITVVATCGNDKANDTTVIAPGDSTAIISNCTLGGRVAPTACTEFHSQLLPPTSLDQPNPSTGNFWLSYQIEPDGSIKCVRDGEWYNNQDNEGAGPMDNYIWSEYTNWKYALKWTNDPHFQQGGVINNTVEITTVACTSSADPTSPSKFKCE